MESTEMKLKLALIVGSLITMHSAYCQVKIEVTQANCENATRMYERFYREVARSLEIPPQSIELIGPVWNYTYKHCDLMITTPLGNMRCYGGELYREENKIGAAGFGRGVNASCSKVK